MNEDLTNVDWLGVLTRAQIESHCTSDAEFDAWMLKKYNVHIVRDDTMWHSITKFSIDPKFALFLLLEYQPWRGVTLLSGQV